MFATLTTRNGPAVVNPGSVAAIVPAAEAAYSVVRLTGGGSFVAAGSPDEIYAVLIAGALAPAKKAPAKKAPAKK